jgi:hypothetical protein
LLTFLKRLQRLKQEWQKIPAGTRQTEGKNMVWFGEIERKLAKLSNSVADPDPGCGIGFFRIPDLGSQIPDPNPIFFRA